jgi:hypothetical protein
MRIIINMFQSRRIEAGGTPDDAMHFISFFQQ